MTWTGQFTREEDTSEKMLHQIRGLQIQIWITTRHCSSPQNWKDLREVEPWLVWLSGLSTGLWTKGLLVWFPVRAHAWVVGQVPSGGCMRGNHTFLFLSFSFSLPSFSLKIKKVEMWCFCCFIFNRFWQYIFLKKQNAKIYTHPSTLQFYC